MADQEETKPTETKVEETAEDKKEEEPAAKTEEPAKEEKKEEPKEEESTATFEPVVSCYFILLCDCYYCVGIRWAIYRA